jgi:hypothetical protein
VWWHDDLNALRKSMSLAKRNWKFSKTESNWKRTNTFMLFEQPNKPYGLLFFRAAGKDVFTAYHFIKPQK